MQMLEPVYNSHSFFSDRRKETCEKENKEIALFCVSLGNRMQTGTYVENVISHFLNSGYVVEMNLADELQRYHFAAILLVAYSNSGNGYKNQNKQDWLEEVCEEWRRVLREVYETDINPLFSDNVKASLEGLAMECFSSDLNDNDVDLAEKAKLVGAEMTAILRNEWIQQNKRIIQKLGKPEQPIFEVLPSWGAQMISFGENYVEAGRKAIEILGSNRRFKKNFDTVVGYFKGRYERLSLNLDDTNNVINDLMEGYLLEELIYVRAYCLKMSDAKEHSKICYPGIASPLKAAIYGGNKRKNKDEEYVGYYDLSDFSRENELDVESENLDDKFQKENFEEVVPGENRFDMPVSIAYSF